MQEAIFHGDFWKPCPGTGEGYICCGYQILTPQRGCGMYCRYCILQVHLENGEPVLFRNYRDMEIEVARKMRRRTGVVRFGTGEFTDSLFADDRLGLCARVAATLEQYGNALVEFKTKSDNISALKRIRRPERVVIGFSLNTPRIISLHEKGTASLEKRFEAARRCEEMGFLVAFHFDPIIWYENWEKEYRETVGRIYSHIMDRERIAWISMGGFRSNPRLKKHLRNSGGHLPLFSGEMINGKDGKLRYFRPYRSAIYSALQDEFERHDSGAALYLCMENREVWETSRMSGRIPGGLVHYLDGRAGKLLGIS